MLAPLLDTKSIIQLNEKHKSFYCYSHRVFFRSELLLFHHVSYKLGMSKLQSWMTFVFFIKLKKLELIQRTEAYSIGFESKVKRITFAPELFKNY